MESDRRVRVALRMRPPLDRERYDTLCARKVDDVTLCLTNEDTTVSKPQVLTKVDVVFDTDDDQLTVYTEAVQDLIDHALDGFNSTIFAYGQTGSGKTHTILGEMSQGQIGPKTGIFLRVFEDLFTFRKAVAAKKRIVITLSAIELYIEEVLDLLNQKAPVKIRERGDDTLLPGVTSMVVNSMQDVIQCFNVANSFRSVTATKLNDESSRSHAIFQIDLFTLPPARDGAAALSIEALFDSETGALQPGVTRSRISLVDLAGSERTKKSGVEGKGMQEANAINKSLTTLRLVISAMYAENSHLPFRDSKLTKLLRSAFTDPTSRLLLIGQISPCSGSFSESTGTTRFCDEVKGLKASARSPYIDPVEEAAYLSILRKNEELAADLRICAAEHFFSPNFVGLCAKRNNIAREEAIEVLIPLCMTRGSLAKQSYESAAREMAEETARFEAQKYINERRQLRKSAENAFAEATAHLSRIQSELESMKETFDAETEKRTTEAKKAKKSRLHATEKIDKLKEKIAAAKKELQAAAQSPSNGGSKSKSLTPAELEADEEWEEFEEDWLIAESNHAIVDDFYRLCSENNKFRQKLISQMKKTEAQWDVVNKVRTEAALAVLGSMVPDVVHFVIDRAVDIAEGAMEWNDTFAWIDIQGSSSKLTPSQFWSPPLQLAFTREPLPPVLNPSNVTELSEGEPETPALQKSKSNVSSPAEEPDPKKKIDHKRRKSLTRKHDNQESDKRYLMGVYDSRTLVTDVLRYLVSGTKMMKHGRSGSPHPRKFWITTIGARELVWVDPENPQSKRTTFPLGEVSSIVLGPFSDVFRRHPVGPDCRDYWQSFTLNLKDRSRTLDIVALSLVDFEAWVLGLAHVCHVDPTWGRPLDLKSEVPTEPLTPQERSVCEKNHIWQNDYLKVKRVVVEHRDEVARHMELFGGDAEHAFDALGGIHIPQMNHKGAVLMTKGELRFHTNPWNIDIFRVCALWQLFASMDIVYDPSYTPATNFGTTVRN